MRSSLSYSVSTKQNNRMQIELKVPQVHLFLLFWQFVQAVAAAADFTVVFDPSATVEAPTVTITQDTPSDPSTVTVTLLVNGSDQDTMKIDVYDDACEAAKVSMVELDPTDFDADCITGLADFAGLAETWLDDYALTAPAPKP
jgi:hypothetical protein